MKSFVYSILSIVFLACQLNSTTACTIFSGIDKKGHVWAGNNEDNIFNFNTYFHIINSTDSTFGFIAFTNSSRSTEYLQGGVNEAGLFYDVNSVSASTYKGYKKKKKFPGGTNALIRHILKKFKTVTEVFQLLNEYRLEGLQSAQFHFADKYGNLGIIVADSMWITTSNHLVSTNYNLCHSNKDGVNCWRFPIAERILQNKEAGFESFKEICDSTQQKNIASTVYSNIHNLNTGDIWLFYGSDFNIPYKTNIRDLLKRGTSSFALRELFTDSPLVSAYKAYQLKGIEAAIEKLDSFNLSPEGKTKVGRLLFYDLIVVNHDFKSYPSLTDLIEPIKKSDELIIFIDAISLFGSDRKKEAIELLERYAKENPKAMLTFLATHLSNLMQGIFAKDANVEFELNGFENAKYVFVEGLHSPNIEYFLIHQNGKWVGKFKLQPDEYGYYFLVDGKRILDPGNRKTIKLDNLEYSKIKIRKKII